MVEAWLAALSSPDGRFDADPAELDALARGIHSWDEIGAGRAGPARATFRLTEIETPADAPSAGHASDTRWRLEFLLQSVEDPSLLVPAVRAWDDDGSLSRWLARPQELLLTELGRASRVYPELAVGLRRACPCGLDLDVDGAHHFLSAVAPALDEAGFGVLLPSWWDRRRKLGLRLSAYTPVDGVVAKPSKFCKDQLTLPVTGVRAEGWLGELLDGALARSVEPVATPDGFGAELRPYQQRGLSWLAFLSSLGLGACLADDMGLGKTVQLLALEAAHRAEDADVGPTLLLCPMSLVGNWQREAAKFTPDLRVYAHHGRERLAGEALRDRLAETDLIVTTYATAARDIDELAGCEWHRVVLYEAQAIKNSLSRSAKAVKRLRAGHRVALTGTPVENRLAELWSIMDFLNAGMLGSSEQFRTRYAIPVERHGLTGPAERLRTITRPYVLRRLKTDPAVIDDLPSKIEIKQYCQLTAEQALKQVCNHPALLLHDRSAIGARSGKVTRLEEIVEEILAEGDKVLCFTQFTEYAEMLLPHLSALFGTDIAYLHGGTARRRRDELVTRFQSGDGPPIFLLSLKAGGTGLNLTAANHVIHLDRWWNPAVENQATDRAFRIGQRRNVQVRKFICTGTLEEKIDEMIEEKKALADW